MVIIRYRYNECGQYFWVTKTWFIFEWQISPSIFYKYIDAIRWKNNYLKGK